MRARVSFVTTLVAAAVGLPAGAKAQENVTPPRLVVLIAVDQLRADMLETFAPAFEGGLRRFLDNGYSFTGASHAHAATWTAAGHATISTGVFPSRSGIVGNDWQQRRGVRWSPMYSVQDDDSEIVGADWAAGRSPRNLLRTGLADWILEADSDARVASISGKDRSAITLAGKSRGHVYWLLLEAGAFVTSEYYRNRYPNWVSRFNRDVMPQIIADTVWESSVPAQFRRLARGDSAAYEDSLYSTFPHVAREETNPEDRVAYNIWALEQPRADRAVLELARVAVDELDLGQRDPIDFLAISLSAADWIGHAFGPLSQEQLDNVVRIDRELGTFLEYLDEEVGEGAWVAALTGDHGAMTMPEHLQATGEDPSAVRTSPQTKRRALSETLVESTRAGGSQLEVAERLARMLEERGIVAKAYTHHELTRGAPADSFATLFRNSHYPGRAHGVLSPYGIEIRYGYHELVYGSTGTTHGTPYWYDRHVPFVLLGSGITAGRSGAPVYTVDIAPTLAALTGIRTPDDLDGAAVNR